MRLPFAPAVALALTQLAACGAPAEESGAAALPRPIVTSGLVLQPQPGWSVEEPASSMRAAQFRLPRANGDDADASFVVYYFGGGGGRVEANLARWGGLFVGGEGEESVRTVGELVLYELAIAGTYVAETAPGSG
ncbi:MAG: hypothetical protein O7B99_14615, partial [Planctomycetota bacterium]|nr:hypothetical protein [Planctomycetota bacterium]